MEKSDGPNTRLCSCSQIIWYFNENLIHIMDKKDVKCIESFNLKVFKICINQRDYNLNGLNLYSKLVNLEFAMIQSRCFETQF